VGRSLLLVRYGVGKRIRLPYTRKIIDAIHSGELLTANYQKTEVFGLEIPTEINGVPSEILDPINTVCSESHLTSSLHQSS
jgi:phosphoenolpyruvate carboxykinase (ATP)